MKSLPPSSGESPVLKMIEPNPIGFRLRKLKTFEWSAGESAVGWQNHPTSPHMYMESWTSPGWLGLFVFRMIPD